MVAILVEEAADSAQLLDATYRPLRAPLPPPSFAGGPRGCAPRGNVAVAVTGTPPERALGQGKFAGGEAGDEVVLEASRCLQESSNLTDSGRGGGKEKSESTSASIVPAPFTGEARPRLQQDIRTWRVRI